MFRPVFWLHHTFLDKILYQYQQKHPNFTYEGSFYNKKAAKNDHLSPFKIKVKDTFNINVEPYCYKYSTTESDLFPPSLSVSKDAEGRSFSLDSSGLDEPIPELIPLKSKFASRNRLDPNKLKEIDEENSLFIEKVNKVINQKDDDYDDSVGRSISLEDPIDLLDPNVNLNEI